MEDRTGGHNPLAALGAHLGARGFTIDLAADGLHVTARRTRGAVPRGAEVVRCRPRAEDFGVWWFFTGQGHPIAPADRIVDAAVFLTGLLTGGGQDVDQAEAPK